MAEGIGLREFGRQHGVTAEAVRKAIADGRIPRDCVGERPIGKQGRVWPVIIDAARAAAHWGRNRDQTQVRDKARMSAGARRGWKLRRGEDTRDDDDDAEADDIEASPLARTGAGAAKGPTYNELRSVTESYKARMAKLEYEQAIGKLVDAKIVAAEHVALLAALRNRLRGIPSQAKSRIPHLTIDEIEILEELIDTALTETADEDDDDEA